MTERKLKESLGLFIMILNAAVILLILGCFYMGGFKPTELFTVLSTVVPMFACYLVVVFSFVVEERYVRSDNSKKVSKLFAATSFAVPTVFGLLIAFGVWLQARGGTNHAAFSNFDEFQRYLLLIQCLFSGYIGRFIYKLFPHVEPQSRSGQAAAEKSV